ncbi:MAG: thrombospondin type 3 repeat-containing protein, partial [Planctomycetes bacterium]|nr:thrombospondin type 3 repeat-containing protein [Planctomycetota bacterium]
MLHPTGVIPMPEPPPDLTANQVVCTNDADCDDGFFCNGQESCDVATGLCLPGTRPCTTFEGYVAPCNDNLDICKELNPCVTWQAGSESGYFFPESNHCPDLASWVLDDVQGSHHTTGVLDKYTTPVISRIAGGPGFPGEYTYDVDQSLFTVQPETCAPDTQIPGAQCTAVGIVGFRTVPFHLAPCSGTMPDLPNNVGDFTRCEIDFFIAYRTTENTAGMLIAGEKPLLGGPAAADDFGVSVIWLEDCPPTGNYEPTFFGDDDNLPADMATAVVCQKPGGTCCAPDGSCSLKSEADCAAVGGTYGGTGTINIDPGSCGGDPDGDGIDNLCGDNCPDDSNPGQEDCDGDGEGDACEADPCERDDDTDGVCNCADNCPTVPNPGQEDTDGDGAGDPCDPCPIDPNDDSDGDGVCDSADQCPGGDDRLDDDSDGVPNDCDVCPGSDDNVPGARDDADGDGVLNCDDRCPGVDDAVFAPQCDGAI